MKAKNRIKILLYGLTQLNVLNPLYIELNKNNTRNYAVKAFQYRVFAADHLDAVVFEKIEKQPFVFTSKLNYYWHLFIFLCNRTLWNLYLTQRSFLKPKSLKAFYKEMFDHYKHAQRIKKSCDVDFYHVNFLTLKNLLPFVFISNKPILMSFWGSDLLRNTDLEKDAFRAFILKKASAITIQNDQLKQIVKSRFPNLKSNSIKVVKFLQDKNFYNLLEKSNFPKSIPLKDKDEISIMVGHNGSSENQHLLILESLKHLETNKNVTIHLLLSYALKEEYHQELLNYLRHYPLSYHIQYEYLTLKELLEYRLKMDILIFAPITDAMSGTVTEAIYLGTQVLAGKWLPYSDYADFKSGITLFDTFDEIPELVQSLIQEDKEKVTIETTRNKLEAIFGNEKNVSIWNRIIESI